MLNKRTVIFTMMCLGSAAVFAAPVQELKHTPLENIAPYPAATSDQIRNVIFVPELENEQDNRVELALGKVMEVDCNRHLMSGTVEEKNLEGWGYNYLVLTDVRPPTSTMMACPDDSKHEEFVRINTIRLERYNSKLPIVIYTPKDIQVRYRIWSTENVYEIADTK